MERSLLPLPESVLFCYCFFSSTARAGKRWWVVVGGWGGGWGGWAGGGLRDSLCVCGGN